MELMTTNLNTHLYIQSEAEFNRARLRGFWETIGSLLTGRSSRLLRFDEVAQKAQSGQRVGRGVKDIRLDDIVGSMGRGGDFTRRFAPLTCDQHNKERWRMIYMLVISGKGFPPVELYKIGEDYFVENGHHRVSVARYLGWKTIHARITEIILPSPVEPPAASGHLRWKKECLCPQV